MTNNAIKKLTQPISSQEGMAFLEEIATMSEKAIADLEVLKSGKDAILMTFDDDKINECLNTELILDKEIQTLEAAKNHLEAKVVELTNNENINKATQIKRESNNSIKRGLSIYEEYKEHAQAIVSLIDELKGIERGLYYANNSVNQLLGESNSLSTVYKNFKAADGVGFDLTKECAATGIRLPNPDRRTGSYINMG